MWRPRGPLRGEFRSSTPLPRFRHSSFSRRSSGRGWPVAVADGVAAVPAFRFSRGTSDMNETRTTEWADETLYPFYRQSLSVDRLLYDSKTEHQRIRVFENARFGRVLTLDGIVQTTEGDEFIYHEMLAHVPILAHGSARRVLIIGGGDGGMAREVLRHRSVERVTMVEIDAGVVEFAKKYLPNLSAGAFDDPRLDLVIADGAAYVAETDERFDVIIVDSTDPIGPG